jgi:hypothetical protein
LREYLIALGDRDIALGARSQKQRLQRFDINRKRRRDVAHDGNESDSRGIVIDL